MIIESVNLNKCKKLIAIISKIKKSAEKHNIDPIKAASTINDIALNNVSYIDDAIQGIRMDMGINNVDDENEVVMDWSDDAHKPTIEPKDLLTNCSKYFHDAENYSASVIDDDNDVVRKVNLSDCLKFADKVISYIKDLVKKYRRYNKIIIKSDIQGQTITPVK